GQHGKCEGGIETAKSPHQIRAISEVRSGEVRQRQQKTAQDKKQHDREASPHPKSGFYKTQLAAYSIRQRQHDMVHHDDERSEAPESIQTSKAMAGRN